MTPDDTPPAILRDIWDFDKYEQYEKVRKMIEQLRTENKPHLANALKHAMYADAYGAPADRVVKKLLYTQRKYLRSLNPDEVPAFLKPFIEAAHRH